MSILSHFVSFNTDFKVFELGWNFRLDVFHTVQQQIVSSKGKKQALIYLLDL